MLKKCCQLFYITRKIQILCCLMLKSEWPFAIVLRNTFLLNGQLIGFSRSINQNVRITTLILDSKIGNADIKG